jgi:Protein of unknown function (DUF1566)
MTFFNNTFTKTLKRLALVYASVLALGAGALHAEPYFIHKEGEMVLDSVSGLVWMRCSLGQTWDGQNCQRKGVQIRFVDAQSTAHRMDHGGYSDWRLPTVSELQRLRASLDRDAFPNVQPDGHWSSSPSSVSGYFDSVDLIRGGFGTFNGVNYVLLVRTSQLSAKNITPDFLPLAVVREQQVQLAERARIVREAAESAERQRREIAEKEERKRQADADRAERLREEAAWRKLLSSGPSNMYLQAAIEQKNGNNSKAEKIYEEIMKKHPNSPFAVKASDQLTAMGRSERQASATREAAAATERAAAAQRDADRNSSNRSACFSQVNSCVANCRASSMSSNGISACVSNCQRSCN